MKLYHWRPGFISKMQPYSIYLHIPFCVHRCAYCDFNTYAGLDDLIEPYTQALCNEIKIIGQSGQARFNTRIPVHTIFFGGGTPSLLNLSQLNRIFLALHKEFDLLPKIEITLEANPGTVSHSYLEGLVNLGVNRLSLGMQTSNPLELKLLERQHAAEDVINSVKWARQAGLSNLNLDLIFGLPSQSLASWLNTLHFALSLKPSHLAIYSLTLEHGTPLAHWVDRGLLSEPDNNLAASMYEHTMDIMEQNGYTQYEISNWSKSVVDSDSFACKHNLQYWRGLPWLGLGAGAHGYIPGCRTVNHLAPTAYIRRLHSASSIDSFPQSPATAEMRTLSMDDERGEYMMMALRLTDEGVSNQEFKHRFGQSLNQAYERQIKRLIKRNLLEWYGIDRIRLTRPGRLLGNQVFMEFI